ncbi:MAG TPA: hypothetical protein PLP29_00295 [Candidatus Ozemobacteraceae bacterium]|nr:hypothetical protein [Candidatus Ozemobacteraceae bacterium]
MLVSCPECSEAISSLTDICPNCGYPVEELGIGKAFGEEPEVLLTGPAAEQDEKYQKSRFEAKFRIVYKEIRIMHDKAGHIDGWIFTRHRYTDQQLLDSEHMTKLDSFFRKIDDDANNLLCSGNAPAIAKNIYYDLRKQVSTDIAELKNDLSNRPLTWWERILAMFKNLLLRFGM